MERNAQIRPQLLIERRCHAGTANLIGPGSRLHLTLRSVARSAKHRSALRRFEGDSGAQAAHRTGNPEFLVSPSPDTATLRLASFAPLGVVHEPFFGIEKLLIRREHKFCRAIDAFQQFVG
jgi:hypothetical protein